VQSLLARPSLLGAVFAVLIGALVYIYLGSSDARGEVKVSGDHAAVLVARSFIEQRDLLTSGDVEVRMISADAVHQTALTDPSEVEGLFAQSALVPGEQILSSHVAELPSGGGLARLVPDGQRAVAIPVSNAIAAGGLVEPGDRVDILAAFDSRDVGWSGTRLVVGNVEVLAISQKLLGTDADGDRDGNDSPPTQISATVTIAVEPRDAQLVHMAEQFGSLTIALRRPDDPSPGLEDPIPLEELVPIGLVLFGGN
jgi:pilus assembly protein CpaB